MAETYNSIYRGKVVEIEDPEKRGRVRVQCPFVLGEATSNWCEPCYPFAYDGGGMYYIPHKNETIWVMFEDGNANKPVWIGNWFSENSTPSQEKDVIVFKNGSTTVTIEKDRTEINTGELLNLDSTSISMLNDFFSIYNNIMYINDKLYSNVTDVNESRYNNVVSLTNVTEKLLKLAQDQEKLTGFVGGSTSAGGGSPSGGGYIGSNPSQADIKVYMDKVVDWVKTNEDFLKTSMQELVSEYKDSWDSWKAAEETIKGVIPW